ncbi:hypothetical protein K1T71_000018 [Dendrolimus kikuchii]|uniref:Uncharacterized protein n=1 Tax=Dendrolimus kikuchii TaxID=765133 RepID=A0ACC1DIH5_9NEOP|nr:hypothetical protein K1T71_000018 [Dendrolimus kikuchii]
MATTLVVATWIVTVSATRYADYSNVKMPQYGGNEYDSSRDAVGRLAADDYHGRSVDAPASLDYKYEEEREDNVKSEESVQLPEESSMWQKLSRKHRSTRSPETNTLEILDSYSLEIDNLPKIRSNHRNKQRPRLKHRSYKRDKDVPKRLKTKYGHDQNDNDADVKEYFRVDKDVGVYKSKNIDDDEITYVRKHTTERIIRRKPRDRYVKSPSDADTELEELAANRRMKGAGRDYNYKLENDDTRDLSVIPTRSPQERYRPVIDEEEEHPPSASHRSHSKDKGKTYDDYNDYYDMKRVNNIKNKLPALLRRTTVTTTTVASVAERELRALLGAHRQRTDVNEEVSTAGTSPMLPLFHPNAVDAVFEKQWNEVTRANRAGRLKLTIYVTLLAFINNLQRYTDVSVCYLSFVLVQTFPRQRLEL